MVLDFANTDTPSGIWGDGVTVWTSSDLDNAIEKNRQWKMERLSWQSPPAVREFLREEIAKSESNEKPRSATLKSGAEFYRYIPYALEREDAVASQARLRAALKLLSTSSEVTPELEAALKAPLRDLQLKGSAAEPDPQITKLDHWWALPLATLCDELIGRVRVCAFRRCDNFFVDWRGRRGGIPRMYCSDKHARAETAQNIRDRKKEERERRDREVRESAERRRLERERHEKEAKEETERVAARKEFRRLKDQRAAANYTGEGDHVRREQKKRKRVRK